MVLKTVDETPKTSNFIPCVVPDGALHDCLKVSEKVMDGPQRGERCKGVGYMKK